MNFRQIIRNWLSGPAKRSAPEIDAETAAAALLVQLAQADGRFDDAEGSAICDVLAQALELDTATAEAVLAKAKPLAHNAVDFYTFTKRANDLPVHKRNAIVEGLWRVAFADGEEDPAEDAMIRKLADLLYVEHRTSRLARSAVASARDES